MLTVQCPKCGQTLRLLERHLGVKGKCLRCAEPIIAERADDSAEIEVLLLKQHREKQVVVTPIESARAEWTPFEMAANENGTFPVMNTNDPSSLPAVSPFGDLNENRSDADAAESTETTSEESQEAEAGAGEKKKLTGFADDAFSGGAESLSGDDNDGESEEAVKSIESATRPKSALPPLPGLAGIASFPISTPPESSEEESFVSSDGDQEEASSDLNGGDSEPHFSEAIESPVPAASDKPDALPWMDLLSGKANKKDESDAVPESTNDLSEDDEAEEAQDPIFGMGEPPSDAAKVEEEGNSSASFDSFEPNQAPEVESKEEAKGKSSDAENQEEVADDSESRNKLNWADGLKKRAEQMSIAGMPGASSPANPKPDEKSEVEAKEQAPKGGDSEDSPVSAPGDVSAEEHKVEFDHFAGRIGNDAKSGADGAAVDESEWAEFLEDDDDEPEPKVKVEAKPTEKKSGVDGADPTMGMVPTVNMVRERRKRRAARRRKRVLMFLMVVAAAVAGLMYFKPGLRPEHLQPAVMASFEEGKSQLTNGEGKFNIDLIFAPIKKLWTQNREKKSDDPGSTKIVIPDVDGKPASAPEVQVAKTESTPEATGEPNIDDDAPVKILSLADADAPPSGEADTGQIGGEAATVAVATPGVGAATMDEPISGAGATAVDEVELTRSSPGENDETRHVRLGGEALLKQFYAARSAEGKLAFVLDPGAVASSLEEAFPSPVEIPSIRSMQFKGRLVDSGSKRAFGVFDVRENENGDRHRWCVPEVSPGEFKLDWMLYQQLANDQLTRFLATPGAGSETFRLLIRRGPVMAEAERPWDEETLEMHLLMPLDDGEPSRILITRSLHDELGFNSDLADGAARVAKVQLSWKEADSEAGLKVPTITGFERWGAW